MPSPQSAVASAEQATGTKDATYNLVSVLYHALQGAETSRHYIQDAEQAGDQELVQFFRAVPCRPGSSTWLPRRRRCSRSG